MKAIDVIVIIVLLHSFHWGDPLWGGSALSEELWESSLLLLTRPGIEVFWFYGISPLSIKCKYNLRAIGTAITLIHIYQSILMYSTLFLYCFYCHFILQSNLHACSNIRQKAEVYN